ncbi:hypothetical protein [Thiorhodococcus mannitoliphagus]|uniref:hypothetical protein n=1 Tax=Thiorhodococcus mannitoliphagus TaxID=329406 RepID=UPI00142F64A5|nr:hypothetical protein [Thiorhodococcus mannitoliphagus]
MGALGIVAALAVLLGGTQSALPTAQEAAHRAASTSPPVVAVQPAPTPPQASRR